MIEPIKKLSHNIERTGVDMLMYPKCKYTYKFNSSHWLDDIDDYSNSKFNISSDDIKQTIIDQLVMEFRHSLNSVVFGDPAGKDYVNAIKNETK